eukprot:CAMPEP_0197445634 /NCGR_PEP_ID=MMETSP1175-20131217/10802_1 /TAXON_ID=1003142 /ORGANISM="Triceratium dubium, Strain CCMP147" /LENGTH=76 /DNA_ID=CAMNT_0042976625 /DNA_START=37 /DNA_END=267 /DNA_ORIENTATION=-
MATGALSRTGKQLAGPKPNQMTVAFNEMKLRCPDEMRRYAECVLANHKSGILEKGSCSAEFALVKDCFRASRRKGS